MTTSASPADPSRVRRVGSFQELLTTPMANGVNALCWERTLAGDFGEVARALGSGEGIVAIDEERLRTLAVSAAGRTAIDFMLADRRRLQEQGLAPELNIIHAYPRDEEAEGIPTDVFSFHADSAPIQADTWLCTYFGPSSEGLLNEEALHRVEVPETRAELLRCFGGTEGEDFEEFLRDQCYDLHYAPRPGARPYVFGVGNLWRIACQTPNNPVPPCIHRAPETKPGEVRLMMIS
ncbi:MAG TPA: hypothetical protein VGD88_18045 [Opitutaceae bacterium]